MTPSVEQTLEGFSYGEFRFETVLGADIGEARATYPSFILMKDAGLISAYETHLNRGARDILELGVMKGGSCALFEALLRPENHLAIDVHRFEGDGLDELTKHVALQGRRFAVDYETSQDNIERIIHLWRRLSGDDTAEFDLVVDDASHNYELSLASFTGLFPLVRPGGCYVIEDWGWAHWQGAWQDPGHADYARPALSNLVVQAAIAVTAGSGMVESVTVTPSAAFIARGPSSDSTFRVNESFPSRGRDRVPF